MLTFDFTVKISNFLYKWVLDKDEGNPRGSLYQAIFSNDGRNGHGMEYCLFFLLCVSIITAFIYYYVVAANIQNATKKNYFTTYIMGYICLWIINYLGLQMVVDANVFASFNLVKICLIDALYYSVLFGISSACMKSKSKAGDIDLFTLIFKA